MLILSSDCRHQALTRRFERNYESANAGNCPARARTIRKVFWKYKSGKKEIQKCPVRNMRVLTKSSKPQECEPVGKSYATYSSSLFIGIFVGSAYLTYSAYQSAFFLVILVPHTYHHYNTIFIVSAYKSKHHIEKHGMIINILNIHIIITSTSLFLTDTVIMIINHCQMTNIMYDDMYDIDMDMYLIWILRGPSLRDHWHKLFPLND